MKRFLVFAYDDYYPSGGLADIQSEFDTLAELHEKLPELIDLWDHVEILDLQEWRRRRIATTTYVKDDE